MFFGAFLSFDSLLLLELFLLSVFIVRCDFTVDQLSVLVDS